MVVIHHLVTLLRRKNKSTMIVLDRVTSVYYLEFLVIHGDEESFFFLEWKTLKNKNFYNYI